jgi:hypothetical protein
MNWDGGRSPLATLSENTTVIAASRATEGAIEAGGQELFTGALLDALEGGAADHMGFVTAPALYASREPKVHRVGPAPRVQDERNRVLTVRECEPLIGRLQLRQLATHFPNPAVSP